MDNLDDRKAEIIMLKMDGLPDNECVVSRLCSNTEMARSTYPFTKAAKLLRVLHSEGADQNKSAPGTRQSPIVDICRMAAQPALLLREMSDANVGMTTSGYGFGAEKIRVSFQ